jgi:hypothetical protein
VKRRMSPDAAAASYGPKLLAVRLRMVTGWPGGRGTTNACQQRAGQTGAAAACEPLC